MLGPPALLEVIEMKAFRVYFTQLLARRDKSFRQRFTANLVIWGGPVMIFEVIQSGILRHLSEVPLFLPLGIIGTVVGAMFITIVEHFFFRGGWPRSDQP
jgi:hypothetical protein